MNESAHCEVNLVLVRESLFTGSNNLQYLRFNMTQSETYTAPVLQTEESYAAFYYTPAGLNIKEATPLEHLAIGQAHGLVVSGKRKTISPNTPVINYAKSGNRWYAQVGVATGSTMSGVARTIWPASKNADSSVFGVHWLSKIVEVPAELFANQLQELPRADRERIFNHVLRNCR